MNNTICFLLVLFVLLLDKIKGDCYTPHSHKNPFQKTKPAERNLDYCQWYNKLTCCTDSPSGLQRADFQGPCGTPSSTCSSQLNLYQCRFCSPFYSDFVDTTTQKLKVCAKFANKLYDDCRESNLEYESGLCKKVKDNWRDGKDFIENVFDHIYVDDNTDCFNQSNSNAPSFLILFLLLLIICTGSY